MSRKYFPYRILLLVLLFCLFVPSDSLYAEEIKIKTEDGVTVVYNPKNPAPPPGTPTRLVLQEDLTIGEKEGEEEYMFVRMVNLDVDDEGRIFVRSYEKVKDGEGFYWDVFDSEGKYIAKVPLKMRPRVWKKNKLYTIEEDDEGYLYVKRYSVEWK